jgi:hypothetical protein
LCADWSGGYDGCQVGPTWVHRVGKVMLGDKNINFLAETLFKLRL